MSRRRGREAQQDVSRRRHPFPTFSIRRLIHTSDEAAAKFCCCFCVPVCPARPCKSFETDSAIPCLCRQEEKEEREREKDFASHVLCTYLRSVLLLYTQLVLPSSSSRGAKRGLNKLLVSSFFSFLFGPLVGALVGRSRCANHLVSSSSSSSSSFSRLEAKSTKREERVGLCVCVCVCCVRRRGEGGREGVKGAAKERKGRKRVEMRVATATL